jgi:hypothetical protein
MNIENLINTEKATTRPVCIDLPDTESVASFFDNLLRWLSEGHRLLLIDADASNMKKEQWLKGYTKSYRIFMTRSEQAFDSRGYQCHRYQIGKGQLDYVPLPVEFDEKDQLNSLLPLNIFTEAEEFNSSYIKYWSRVIAPTQDWENEKDFEEPFQYDLDKFKNNIPRLGFEEFRKLYESDKRLITWNESIWKNTFKEILTTEIVNGILNREKYGSR